MVCSLLTWHFWWYCLPQHGPVSQINRLPDRGCLTCIVRVYGFSSRYTVCQPCIYLPVQNQDTRFSPSSFSMMNCDCYVQLHYDTRGMRYEKENTNVEKKVGGGSADSCHVEESKVLLTIAFCGWCTLIILLLLGFLRAGVVSHYSFSFPVRNRQCLEHTCGNAPNFIFPPVHYIIPVTGR